MINKYIVVLETEYDDGLYGTTICEFQPCQSKYSKTQLFQAYLLGRKNKLKRYQILDTGITILQTIELVEILTIQEWFTIYGVGVRDETKEEAVQRINNQYHS